MPAPSLLCGAPEALTAHFAHRPYDTIRRVLRVPTETPQPLGVIANRTGKAPAAVHQALDRLRKTGLAIKVSDRGYVRNGPVRPGVDEDAVPPEVGRQILSCLTEPRRARDIAAIIDRAPSVATGHLQHLRRRGLVTRVAKGVYALTARVGREEGLPLPPVPKRVATSVKDVARRSAKAPKRITVSVVVPECQVERLLRFAARLRGEVDDGARTAQPSIPSAMADGGAGMGSRDGRSC